MLVNFLYFLCGSRASPRSLVFGAFLVDQSIHVGLPKWSVNTDLFAELLLLMIELT